MNFLINIKNNFKKAYNSNVLSTLGSLVMASTILITSYAYFWRSTIKILKPRRINRKEDEKIVDTTSISLASFNAPLNQEEVLEEEIEPVIPKPISEDALDDVVTDVGKELYDKYLTDMGIYNNENLEKSVNDAVNIQLIKYGIVDVNPSNEEKINWILNHYNLTMDEFKVVVGVVLAEAKEDSYEDAYCVINTIFNRTISFNWGGNDLGTNLYYQVVRPGQFSVYSSGSYKKFLNASPENNPGMQAVIDFLYGEFEYDYDNLTITWLGPARLHNYLGFRSSGTNLTNYEQFTSRGNKYKTPMADNDYASNLFKNISERELEQIAIEKESLTKEYRTLINSGVNKEQAIKLVREKSN